MNDKSVSIYSKLDKPKYPKSNLEKLREEKNETQEKIADLIGCNRKTYANYERNLDDPKYQPPYVKHLLKLSEHYNVSTDYILGLSDCRSVDNNYISKQTGLSDDAIERLKSWNYDHYGYEPYEEYTRPLNMVLESIQAKNIMKAVLQYLDADMAIIKKVTAYDIGEDRPIEINDLDPARTTFDFEYPDGSSITGTVFNPSLLRTDALNQVRECLDIMRKELEKGESR